MGSFFRKYGSRSQEVTTAAIHVWKLLKRKRKRPDSLALSASGWAPGWPGTRGHGEPGGRGEGCGHRRSHPSRIGTRGYPGRRCALRSPRLQERGRVRGAETGADPQSFPCSLAAAPAVSGPLPQSFIPRSRKNKMSRNKTGSAGQGFVSLVNCLLETLKALNQVCGWKSDSLRVCEKWTWPKGRETSFSWPPYFITSIGLASTCQVARK